MQIKRVRSRRKSRFTESRQGSTDGDLTDYLFPLIVNNLLVFFIILAVVIGIILGHNLYRITNFEYSVTRVYMKFPSRILLNMLQMMIIPLLTSSIVAGMSGRDMHASGKMIAAAGVYHLFTGIVAFAIVTIVMLLNGPVDLLPSKMIYQNKTFGSPYHAFLDMIGNAFPDNIIKACSFKAVTELRTDISEEKQISPLTVSNTSHNVPMPVLVSKPGTNILGLVVVSTIFGYSINFIQWEGRPLKQFFLSMNQAMTTIVNILIWYSPIGLIFTIACMVLDSPDIEKTLSYLGQYLGIVLGVMAFHSLIDLPFIYLITTRQNPFIFGAKLTKALFAAWGTNSSSTTIPITVKCLVKNCKLNASFVKFMIPFSTSFNIDGTMFYETLTSIFIAQKRGFHLTLADIVVVGLTTTAASFGAGGIPQSSGIVTIMVVLLALGFPTEDVTIIISIDWFLDRFKTAVNVWGDCVGAGVLNHLFEQFLLENQQLKSQSRHRKHFNSPRSLGSFMSSTSTESFTSSYSDHSIISDTTSSFSV